MPRPTDERTRVLGPTWIPSRQRWRIVVVTPQAARPEDRRTTSLYREKAEADEVAENTKARLENITVGIAIEKYQQHLHDKGTGAISYTETIRRLKLFFLDKDMLIGRVSPDRAKAYYDAFRRRTFMTSKGERTFSVSYHRAALSQARSLMKFAIGQKWIGVNPFAEVEGVGRKNTGKLQHTGDESRKLGVYCLARAENGDEAALGVLLVLSMALRSSDLTRRFVRDVDFGGTVLRVERGKTKKSNRPRKIPIELQPLVRRLVDGRSPFEPLFKTHYTKHGHHTGAWLQAAMERFCAGAGVPQVCPHALKGTAGNLLSEDGTAADIIMNHLSHTELSTTKRHYVEAGAMESAQAGRVFSVLSGGKK